MTLVGLKKEGGIATVTFHNPPRGYMNAAQIAELHPVIDDVAADGEVRVIVFTGGGFEFALCCDVRVAEAGDYRIGLPETNVGIFPGAGGTERLPRVIGEARALELILRGRTVDPAESCRLGLVHEYVEGSALARAYEIARELATKPPRGLADAKALIKGSTTMPLADACARARAMFAALLIEDDDAVSLMSDFLRSGEDINRS